MNMINYGWVCPLCKAVISPLIDMCPNCQGIKVIVTEELKELSRKFQEGIKDLPEEDDYYCEPIIFNGEWEPVIKKNKIPTFDGEWG